MSKQDIEDAIVLTLVFFILLMLGRLLYKLILLIIIKWMTRKS